jgi:SET domain-containing protein
MKSSLVQKPLQVKKSPIHGYGVFAKAAIDENEIIEECHVIHCSKGNISPELNDICFGVTKKSSDVVLGFGSIYNHSLTPNADYIFDDETKLMIFSATRFIAEDEEIFISYGKDWFSSRNTVCKEATLITKVKRYLRGVPLRAGVVLGGMGSLYYLLKYVS